MSESENTNYTNLEPGSKPVPIVAIGGSAGGQQAVSELLLHLPAVTGLAFVYIQHLSADYDSKLDVILSAKTAMPVVEAVNLMPVQADHLYVIPPGKIMEVIDGVLVLMPREPKPQPHLPVDQFFTSLAERQKDGAIGIVLSGMASDGTLGLKAIKVAGGITFAQDQTAAYQGMPQSAISEGVVDMVLSPKEIVGELLRLSNHADIFKLTAETSEISQNQTEQEELKKILAFVKSTAGVDFTHYKKTTITRRIIRRMLLYKLDTFADYVAYLKKHPAEASILFSDLLINVTNFFRDPAAMEHLKKQVLPRIIAGKRAAEPVRIWVAGCSTGQEAYSLAILILELLGERNASKPVQIFATDLSDAAIAKARLGIFSKSEVTDVSPERLNHFFSKTDEQHYRVNKPVRDLCVFAPHNLLSDPPFSRIDLISCRNLLIYLDEELQKKVFATFHYALKADGYLFLGKSESVAVSPSYFSQIEKLQKVFTRKNNAQTKIPLDMVFKSNTSTPQFKAITLKTTELVSVNDLDKLVDNLLLSAYVPASVVIDQDMEIIQFRGITAPYLQHPSGKASLNLTKMAHPSLVFELRNIVHKARKSAAPAQKSGLEINYLDKPIYVNIEAVPITNPDNQQLFLVLFNHVSEHMFLSAGSLADSDQRNQLLEAELTALRQDMHSIVEEQEASNEELQSANEEIVSSNEELQSINEELETSKEEIESANEELQTINQELQLRNDQLTESHEYAEAILSTINEATLVLDEQLRVKSANSAFYRIFDVKPENTEDHLIYELSGRQLDFVEFRELIHQVVTHNAAVKDLETDIRISASQVRTMVIHARKLTLHQKQIILLGFEDITGHRKEQQLLKKRQQWFEELVDHAPAMIWVCQTDGKINYLNKAWVAYTGEPFKENEATLTAAIHPEDLSQYQDTFFLNLGRQKEFSCEYRLKRSDGAYRWVLENAKPMFSSEGAFTGYTGSSMDIHLQKTLTEQLNMHVEEKTADLKDANQQLVQGADRLQSVLNGVPASVTLMEPVYENGTVVDFKTSVFNNKALELTGQSSEQTLVKTLLESYPDFKETGLFDLYVHVLQSGETTYRELTGLISENQTLAFLIMRQIDQTGIVVTVLDISARKNAEIKLTEVAQSLQAVLDSSPASIAFFKAVHTDQDQPIDFTLIVCNQKFSSEFKKPDSELVGMLASSLYPVERCEQMKQVYLTREVVYEEVMLDGHPKWIAASMTQHDHGVAVTELDITELKHAGFQQQTLLLQLQGSSEMVESLAVMKEYVQSRGAFLRSSFHDLRGSFSIIIGAASLLNSMDSETEREMVLDMIQRNLAGVSHMMNQMLDYSRLESGEEKFQNERFDAGQLLTELCEGSMPSALQKDLYFRFEGPANFNVEGDHVKVRRIAQNLVLNAIKYTDQGGVTVLWQPADSSVHGDGFWQFVVSDTGAGIPEQLIAKLNELPSQHPDSNIPDQHTDDIEPNTEGHGEGIGLFIVKRLCELLKASMRVSSENGSGTTFCIILPMSYSPGPAAGELTLNQ